MCPPPSPICDYVIYVRPLRALTLSCLFRQCVGFNIPVEVGQEASYLLEAGPHKLSLFLVLVVATSLSSSWSTSATSTAGTRTPPTLVMKLVSHLLSVASPHVHDEAVSIGWPTEFFFKSHCFEWGTGNDDPSLRLWSHAPQHFLIQVSKEVHMCEVLPFYYSAERLLSRVLNCAREVAAWSLPALPLVTPGFAGCGDV